MDEERVYRTINTRMMIVYFLSLISIQLLGVLYFIRHPTVASALTVAFIVGVGTPILLGLTLIKVVKVIYKKDLQGS